MPSDHRPPSQSTRRYTVLDHWYEPVENFSTSAREFYAQVERAIGVRQVPQLHSSRVIWSESGVFSADREYLRLKRGPYVFDICAAPFGTGYFFSWWFTYRRPPAIIAIIVMVIGAIFCGAAFGWLSLLIILPLAWLGAGLVFVATNSPAADYLLVVPLLGLLWEKVFLPDTYYRIDTQLMYRSVVHAAVLEVYNRLTDAPQAVREGRENEAQRDVAHELAYLPTAAVAFAAAPLAAPVEELPPQPRSLDQAAIRKYAEETHSDTSWMHKAKP